MTRNKRMGYNLDIMRRMACLVFNPVMVDSYAFLFDWLLRQAVITTPTWISLDKLCIDKPVLTCKKHVLICLSN